MRKVSAAIFARIYRRNHRQLQPNPHSKSLRPRHTAPEVIHKPVGVQLHLRVVVVREYEPHLGEPALPPRPLHPNRTDNQPALPHFPLPEVEEDLHPRDQLRRDEGQERGTLLSCRGVPPQSGRLGPARLWLGPAAAAAKELPATASAVWPSCFLLRAMALTKSQRRVMRLPRALPGRREGRRRSVTA